MDRKGTRGRKNKAVSQEDAHRWIVSYADFITLLFAFFVVMYAMSSVNISKYKTLSEGMQSAFSKKNTRESSPSTDAHLQDRGAFEELGHALSALHDKDYQINKNDGWIELDIKAGSLFNSGSADLRPHAILKLMKLSNIVKDLPYPIALEGYTDNVPIATPRYPSNWELSSARASAVARSLTAFGVRPDRISVTGFGSQYPIADNFTEYGRAKNRRVNLIIAKDKSIPRLLNPGVSIKSNTNDVGYGVIKPTDGENPADGEKL